jgi:hypothetical protein
MCSRYYLRYVFGLLPLILSHIFTIFQSDGFPPVLDCKLWESKMRTSLSLRNSVARVNYYTTDQYAPLRSRCTYGQPCCDQTIILVQMKNTVTKINHLSQTRNSYCFGIIENNFSFIPHFN